MRKPRLQRCSHPTTHNSYIISALFALPKLCIIFFAICAISWFNHTNFKSSPKEKRRYRGYGLVSDKNEIKSEVETALIRDCFLNLFSFDQIPQFRYSANAKLSFICSPNNCLALPAKSLNSSSWTIPTNNLKYSISSSNSASVILDFLQISSLCLDNSLMQSAGVYSSKISKEVINFRVVESF